MVRPEDHFLFVRPAVNIVSLHDPLEALTLRAALESMRISVTLHLPGTPGDFLHVLAQAPAPAHLIICGHGTETGFVFPEYAPEIDTSMLTGGCLPPSAIAPRVNLRESLVLSTACLSGSPEMARAMLAGGARAYVAPNDYPDGADTVLFTLALFHSLFERDLSVMDALQRAQTIDPEFKMFQLYTA